MDIEDYWQKALKQTEIVRPRIQPLLSHKETHLPYIFLAESVINVGDTVVREGEVVVEKPSIILPSNYPQLEGFDTEEDTSFHPEMMTNFLLIRGIRFPSYKYNNRTYSLEIREGRLKAAIEEYSRKLQSEENVSTGLVIGPEDCWQFSVLIFVGSQVLKTADQDIKKLLDDYKKRYDD
ncbi:MAG: hypothetical protein JW893_00140 [Candidatus Omnitrophica bacterium]|nr:hypothetical protein [Candidatus Omnitrophota bacterium]